MAKVTLKPQQTKKVLPKDMKDGEFGVIIKHSSYDYLNKIVLKLKDIDTIVLLNNGDYWTNVSKDSLNNGNFLIRVINSDEEINIEV